MQTLLARRPGIQLEHAPTGEAGLGLIRSRRPELVFLDLHLPDMPGREVLRRLWENPETRTIPVAVLTADATQAQRRRLLSDGAVAYLTKPFDIAEVLALIDRTVKAASTPESGERVA